MENCRLNWTEPGITSVVITDNKEWYDRGLLMPHETIRRLTMQMIDGTNETNFDLDKNPWKAQVFVDWFKFYYSFVHFHHDIEETIYFPWVDERVKIPEILRSEHSHLMYMLNQIKKLSEEVALKLSLEKAREMNKLMITMAKEMFEHLVHEEKFIPNALKENFTEAEEKTLIQEKILKQMKDPNELVAVLDAMKQWASKEQLEAFMNDLPFIPATLYKLVWRSNYDSYIAAKINSLFGNVPYVEGSHCTIQ